MSADPPPPYPGFSGQYNDPASYPPPNPAFPAPYDPSKSTIYGPPTGYAPPAGHPPTQMYTWQGQPSQQYGQTSGYAHGTTVVVAQPPVTLIQTFRESPVHTRCPHCQAEVVTGTHFETGTFTWVICCVLWLVGCGLGCCLIPFCVDGCKDVIHTCPNCRQQVARYTRM